MSRDYKRTSGKSNSGKSAGPFLLGLFIGLLLGLAIALGVAWYINKMPSPFTSKEKPPALPETRLEPPAPQLKAEEKQAKTGKSKPRFDFYKILPGAEEPVTDQELRQAAKQPSKDLFFLQAGAFQNLADADNLKAKLALLGVEASIQSATLPDKGLWHRVRAGPYSKVDELNRVRATLKQNGIDASLIKVRDAG
ncbi:MAG: SPOR domain-containing protein [Burkholderiales bacterium]